MTTQVQLVTLLPFVFACTRAPSQPVEPPPAPVDTSGPLEIEFGDRILEPSAFVPEPPGGFADEPEIVGWSSNTGEFIVCYNDSSDCDMNCDFHRVGAEPEHVSFGDAPDEMWDGKIIKICDQPSSALEHRLAVGDFRIEDGDWAYGADVVLVVAEGWGEPDSEGVARHVVQIGARLRSEGASVAWVESIDGCDGDDCPLDAHIDAIAPSPDGQTIAVLVHTHVGASMNTYPVALLDARSLADAASNR
jgi:hypothetical protein